MIVSRKAREVRVSSSDRRYGVAVRWQRFRTRAPSEFFSESVDEDSKGSKRTHRPVESGQGRICWQTIEAVTSVDASNHGIVLPFRECLVVLVPGPAARKFYLALFAETQKRLVHENSVVVRAEAEHVKRQTSVQLPKGLVSRAILDTEPEHIRSIPRRSPW